MPKAFPLEFRRDVVAVARKGGAPAGPDREGFRGLRVGAAALVGSPTYAPHSKPSQLQSNAKTNAYADSNAAG
jgi:hypothetical protein